MVSDISATEFESQKSSDCRRQKIKWVSLSSWAEAEEGRFGAPLQAPCNVYYKIPQDASKEAGEKPALII